MDSNAHDLETLAKIEGILWMQKNVGCSPQDAVEAIAELIQTRRSKATLDALAKQAQELGMGY